MNSNPIENLNEEETYWATPCFQCGKNEEYPHMEYYNNPYCKNVFYFSISLVKSKRGIRPYFGLNIWKYYIIFGWAY